MLKSHLVDNPIIICCGLRFGLSFLRLPWEVVKCFLLRMEENSGFVFNLCKEMVYLCSEKRNYNNCLGFHVKHLYMCIHAIDHPFVCVCSHLLYIHNYMHIVNCIQIYVVISLCKLFSSFLTHFI